MIPRRWLIALLGVCACGGSLDGAACGLVYKGSVALGAGCFEVWPAQHGVLIGDDSCSATSERHLVTDGEIHLWAPPLVLGEASARTLAVSCPK